VTQTQASFRRSDLIKVLTLVLYEVTESLGFAQLSRSLDCTPDLSAFLLLGPYLTNRGDSVTVPQMKVFVESLDQFKLEPVGPQSGWPQTESHPGTRWRGCPFNDDDHMTDPLAVLVSDFEIPHAASDASTREPTPPCAPIVSMQDSNTATTTRAGGIVRLWSP